jgi:hypothetical protein
MGKYRVTTVNIIGITQVVLTLIIGIGVAIIFVIIGKTSLLAQDL